MNEIKINHDLSAFTGGDWNEQLAFSRIEASRTPHIDWTKIKRAMKRFLSSRFVRKNGISVAFILLVALYGLCVSTITEFRVSKRLTAELSDKYAAEYDAKLEAFIEQQEMMYRVVGDGSIQAQIEQEADAIARVIGKMKTKRMKQSELWNILMRVDSPSPIYPDTIEEVIAVPGQWMFYEHEGNNPIKDDDRNLAIEQLRLWHDGRYPAGLTADFVIGEWSENDYVLRDQWEKTSKTNYWRMPE